MADFFTRAIQYNALIEQQTNRAVAQGQASRTQTLQAIDALNDLSMQALERERLGEIVSIIRDKERQRELDLRKQDIEKSKKLIQQDLYKRLVSDLDNDDISKETSDIIGSLFKEEGEEETMPKPPRYYNERAFGMKEGEDRLEVRELKRNSSITEFMDTYNPNPRVGLKPFGYDPDEPLPPNEMTPATKRSVFLAGRTIGNTSYNKYKNMPKIGDRPYNPNTGIYGPKEEDLKKHWTGVLSVSSKVLLKQFLDGTPAYEAWARNKYGDRYKIDIEKFKKNTAGYDPVKAHLTELIPGLMQEMTQSLKPLYKQDTIIPGAVVEEKADSISLEHGVNPIIIKAMLKSESGRGDGFINTSPNKEKAAGIAQLTPIAIKDINQRYGTQYTLDDRYNPDKAISMMAKYIKLYNPKNTEEVAILYHNGPDELNEYRKTGEIKGQRTKTYVSNVVSNYEKYKKQNEG